MLSFILGAGVAILTFGGIMLGVKILMSLQNPDLSRRQYRIRVLGAAFILIAQFVFAGALLYFSNLRAHRPLPLAAGLVLGIFGLYALLRSFEKDKV